MARVIVPDFQLSLAIGKEGQNARLAAKLTGWKIDIKSESQLRAHIEQQLLNYNPDESETGSDEIEFEPESLLLSIRILTQKRMNPENIENVNNEN